jgi:hypothetical protein
LARRNVLLGLRQMPLEHIRIKDWLLGQARLALGLAAGCAGPCPTRTA